MHRSRLGAIVIDCEGEALDAAAGFWSAAFGYPARGSDDPRDAHYRRLESPPGEVDMILQRVDHPSRVHLDIETDDVAAEALRLEALGAKRVAEIREWIVLEAPSGHRFCVIPVERPGFDAAATTWD